MIARMVNAINLRFSGVTDLRKALDELEAQRAREAQRAAEMHGGEPDVPIRDHVTPVDEFLRNGIDDIEESRADVWDADFTENADPGAASQWKVRLKGC